MSADGTQATEDRIAKIYTGAKIDLRWAQRVLYVRPHAAEYVAKERHAQEKIMLYDEIERLRAIERRARDLTETFDGATREAARYVLDGDPK